MAGFSAVGVAAGHALDYMLVVPDRAHRDHVLAETGHGHFSEVVTVAAILAAAAATLVVARGLRLGAQGAGAPRRPLAREAAPFMLLQVVLFAGLEVGERLIAGGTGDRFGLLLAFGLLLQPVVALAGVLLVRVLLRVGERLGSFFAPAANRPGRGARLMGPASWSSPIPAIPFAPLPPRGPPHLLVD